MRGIKINITYKTDINSGKTKMILGLSSPKKYILNPIKTVCILIIKTY